MMKTETKRLLKRNLKYLFKHIRKFEIAGMLCYDAVMVNLAYFLALFFRFECHLSYIPISYLKACIYFMPVYALISIAVFYLNGMYDIVYKYAGFDDTMRSTLGSIAASLLHTLIITALLKFDVMGLSTARMPVSYYIFGFCIQGIFIVGIRLSGRLAYTLLQIKRYGKTQYTDRVMLIGAGEAGALLLRAMRRERDINEKICCIIDDDSKKWGKKLENVPIHGGRDTIFEAVKKYKIDKIYLAIPSASAEEKRQILSICSETDCKLKNLPSSYLSMSGEINYDSLKNVSVEDLLGREPIKANMDEIFDFIKGKTVLVTGGGGSIGGELCRQIAGHSPKKLILFDVYENNAYDVQFEIRKAHPELDFETLIGSVRDTKRMESIFRDYEPDVVYHAAAHKHVPLIEDSPCEAIKNNVLGTYKTAYAAMMHGCKRFVLISTDKAVNPTNVMGASKRLCEMVIQSFDQKIKQGKTDEIVRLFTHAEDGTEISKLPEKVETEFVAVRFGNVLGSHGSVIPLFKKQIQYGGPVTVTHPDIIRYFMTIPEAVSLVLLAGTYAKGGEIFIFDMGEPVKIDTLARNLIKLVGLKPDVDIKIEYTGLRPGEKLYEEKLMCEEGLRRTANDLIHVANPLPFDTDWFQDQLVKLMKASHDNDKEIRNLIKETVSTYNPDYDPDKIIQ